MKDLFGSLLLSTALALPAALSQAAEPGLSPQETYALIQSQPSGVLLVDVRDPVEIMFVGFTDEAHINIPYLIVDRDVWDAQNKRFSLRLNPDFAAEVETALRAHGLDRSATVITMCRSGSERGLPSAAFLRDNGVPNARYVINGFQGEAVKDGENAGLRIKNGWQNSGLPWGTRMDPEKIYRSDR